MKRKYLLYIFITAALLRTAYIFTLEEKWYFFDSAHYDSAARAILEEGTFGPSLHFYNEYENYCLEPAYPIFLAAIYGIFGHSFLAVRLIQMLLSLLQLFFIYKIVQHIKPKAAPYALMFGAVYPFFIYTAGLLYVTQLFALLLTLMVYWLIKYRENWGLGWLSLATVALAVAISARPVVAPSTVLLAAWIFFFAQIPWLKRIGHIAWTALLVIFVLAPWTVRNWNVFHVISPGRACLAETRVFEDVRREFAEEDAFSKATFDAKRLRVDLKMTSAETLFVCTLDDSVISILKPMEQLQLSQPMHTGMILRGGESFRIESVSFDGDRSSGEMQRLSTASDVAATSSGDITIDESGIHLADSDDAWKYSFVFKDSLNFTTAELVYPDSVSPFNIRRAALLFGLDSSSPESNGYMLWLQPWRATDLWLVENGLPVRPIEVLDLHKKANPISPAKLIVENPGRFFTKHFLPEFLNFWTPLITRITTSSNVRFVMNIASFIFFAPLLLLSIVGIGAMLKKWRVLLLILMPIINISLFYSVFFTELRYRIPIDGFLIVLSAVGLYSIVQIFRGKKL